MTRPDPLAAMPAWMAQLADTTQWQNLLKPLPLPSTPGGTPAIPGMPAVELDPAAMAALQVAYLQELGSLWQHTLGSSTPAVND